MALLHLESFDGYATTDLEKTYTKTSASGGTWAIGAYGRRSTNGLRVGGNNYWQGQHPAISVAASGATCLIGFAFNHSTGSFAQLATGTNGWDPTQVFAPNCLCSILQGGSVQVWFQVNASGQIVAYRSTTELGTTASSLTTGNWTYVEIAVVIDDSTGSVTIKFDGNSVLALTNQDTKSTSSATWDQVRLGGISPSDSTKWSFDDFYLADGSGADGWTALKGDLAITAYLPDTDGATHDWTCSTGSDHSNLLDEDTPNGDTDYTEATTAGLVDTMTFANLTSGHIPKGVQVRLCATKPSGGTATVAPVIRMGGTDYAGTAVGAPADYAYVAQCYGVTPDDSGAWTEADFNDGEFGYKKVS